jgi:hypothetical protein
MRRLLFLLLSISLLSPIDPARAAGINVTSIEATYTFAQTLTFKLQASSDSPITQARVFFQSGGNPPIEQQPEPFTPSDQVDLSIQINLQTNKLPAFSTISYWWEIADQAGDKLQTDTHTLTYIDNRFDWQEMTSGVVRVHWYQGDSGFGATAASIANAALPRIQQQLGAQPPSPIDIYIYAAVDDLRSAVELAGRDWLGGQARPELGVVLVAIPPGADASLQMRRDIPHELTHLMVFIATTPSYAFVPSWLDEGLATFNEGDPNPTEALALQAALAANQLAPLDKLCGPFSTDASAALAAYAESRGVVQQIIDQYGSAGIQGLLAAYRDGASCDGGVERALNTTLNGLELQWRSSLSPSSGAEAVASGSGPWLLLLVLVGLPLLGLLPRRKSTSR